MTKRHESLTLAELTTTEMKLRLLELSGEHVDYSSGTLTVRFSEFDAKGPLTTIIVTIQRLRSGQPAFTFRASLSSSGEFKVIEPVAELQPSTKAASALVLALRLMLEKRIIFQEVSSNAEYFSVDIVPSEEKVTAIVSINPDSTRGNAVLIDVKNGRATLVGLGY